MHTPIYHSQHGMRWMSTITTSCTEHSICSLIVTEMRKVKALDPNIIGELQYLIFLIALVVTFLSLSLSHWSQVVVAFCEYRFMNVKQYKCSTLTTKHISDSDMNQERKRHLWSTCVHVHTVHFLAHVCSNVCVCVCRCVCSFSPLGSFKRLCLEEVLWCFVKDSWARMKEKIPHPLSDVWLTTLNIYSTFSSFHLILLCKLSSYPMNTLSLLYVQLVPFATPL